MAEKPADASNLQGSQDTFVQALTSQMPGVNPPSPSVDPVAAARAKLRANIAGGNVKGWAGGTSDTGPGEFAKIVAAVAPGGAGQIGIKNPSQGLPVMNVDDMGRPVADVINRPPPAAVTVQPGPQTPVGQTLGAQVTPASVQAQPVPNPQLPAGPQHPLASFSPHHAGAMHPATHSLEDFSNAMDGLSWRQAQHMLAWAPQHDMSSPADQAQATLHGVSQLGVNSYEAAYRQAMQRGDHAGAQVAYEGMLKAAQQGMPQINPMNTTLADQIANATHGQGAVRP